MAEVSQPAFHFYNKTRDWIEESILDKHVIPDFYKEFYREEIIHLPTTKGIDPPQWALTCKFGSAFVAIIQGGSMLGNITMTPTKKMLRDTAFPIFWNSFNPEQLPPITHYANTAAAIMGGQNNYYHWLIDCLPRFHLIQISGIPIDNYVLPKLSLPYQFETFDQLGIPREKLIQMDSQVSHLKAEKLVVTSLPYNLGSCPKWSCDFLRKTFVDGKNIEKSGEYERIYVSREDAMWRKVINDDEVMNVLSQKGFKKVTMSSLSVQKQIEIFSSAKCIISPNGAQLANLVFCNPGTKVIELFTNTADCFLKISSYVGLDHYHLKCEIAHSHKENIYLDNITVDLNKLMRMLECVGIG